jgi:ATP synthase proteolipid subunit
MAGIIGIYGLVVSVLIANDLGQSVPLYTGFIQLGAGLSVGLAGMAAGYVPPLSSSLNCVLFGRTDLARLQLCHRYCR